MQPVIETPDQSQFQKWNALPEEQKAPSAAATEKEPAPEPAQASEPGDKTAEEDSDEKLPKGLRRRFRELTTKIRVLEDELAAKPAAEATREAAAPVETRKSDDGRPKRPVVDDFASWKEYEDAQDQYVSDLADWKLKQAREEDRKAAEQQKQQATQAQEKAAWDKQLDAAKKEYEDFEDVAHDPDLPVTDSMFYVIRHSDNGAKLLYHLGQHPDLAASLAAMPPGKAALALGKLEAKLFPDSESAETQKPVAAVSKTPKPPKALTGATSAEDLEKEPDPKDFAKWAKWKDRQERRDRG